MVFRREYRFFMREGPDGLYCLIKMEGNMVRNCETRFLCVFVPVTVVAGSFLGCLLRYLILINNGIHTSEIDISAETAVKMMIVLIIYMAAIVFQLIYTVWKKYKIERQCALIEYKTDAGQTELMDAIDRIQREYVKAEKIHTARIRFMTRMSHDLRTPMNAILGYSILIERFSNDTEKVTRYARRIFVSGQMLLELINDALDMRCIEKGNVKLIETEFSLMTALEEVKTAIKPQVEAKGQTFRLYITNSADVDWIVGDKQRLCQVFRNVLSNASKYTGENGCIEMVVNITGNRRQDVQMMCQIKDNGCGMSKEFLQVMFKPYEREDNEMNTSIPGTGLGLCIARSFTELMKGKLSVDSELGRGTQVTISIPLSVVDDHEKCISSSARGDSVLNGLHFLAAEDNDSNAEILSEVLNAMGATCVIVEHGQAAVEIFENSPSGQFDIILMDIQMPVMDGYQAATAIRKSRHPDAEKIKIIAMTADAFEEDVCRAYTSGMNAHVAKPLNLESFINTVASL